MKASTAFESADLIKKQKFIFERETKTKQTKKENVLSPFTNTQESFFQVILNHLRFPSQRAFLHGVLYRIGVVRTITDSVIRILMPGPIQCDSCKKTGKDK
ncbi:MAG: hypothetical protein FWE54_03765 [Methanimicrococcus sp.]|nr:hypothetical protein [Methanimicrococcus sp.]